MESRLKISLFKFDNFMKYIYLRATFVGLFLEVSKLPMKRIFLNFLFANFIPILYSIFNNDYTFFKIIYLTTSQFINKDFSIPNIPKARYSYREIGVFSNIGYEIPKISVIDRIFLPKFLCIQDNFKNEIKVFEKFKVW